MSTLQPQSPVPSGAATLPVALAPFADPDRVSTPFPCVLHADGIEPLPDLLDANGEGTILRDNLRRLELTIRRAVADGSGPVEARGTIAEAGGQMLEALRLSAAASEALATSVQALLRAVPDGVLLPYGPDVAIELLARACHASVTERRRGFLGEAARLLRDLRTRLQVEERYEEPPNGGGLPTAGGAIDPAALAGLVGTRRGSVAMDPGRRARLERLVAAIADTLEQAADPELIVVHGDHRPSSWRGSDAAVVVTSAHPELDATRHFDAQAAPMARLIGAVRGARLELADAWDDATHGPLLEGFAWSECTDDELPLLAPVIVVLSEAYALGDGMRSLSDLLASARPVQVLIEVAPGRSPALRGGDEALAGYRVDPAMVAMAHRHIFVQQSTPARPDHLLRGYERVLSRAQPGVHLVYSGHGARGPVGAWMAANAAVESRALPLFHYDPAAGETWADCMDVAGNPYPERDWGGSDDEEFTFADFAVIDPELADAFRPAREGERTAPVCEWLRLRKGDPGLVPVVRCVVDGAPAELVPSLAVLEACVERRGGWRALRELGGVANEHARRAADAVRAELHAAMEERLDALQAAHAADLEQARRQAGSEALARLAAALLDESWTTTPSTSASPVAAAPAPATAPAAAPAAEAEPAPAPEPVAAESASAEDEDEEPWVESEICTSCNDCLQVNPALFVYNDNKQIEIGDLSAGTYADLVIAAEKCPAKCIHPGTPQNPSEPGIAELRVRAAAVHGGGA